MESCSGGSGERNIRKQTSSIFKWIFHVSSLNDPLGHPWSSCSIYASIISANCNKNNSGTQCHLLMNECNGVTLNTRIYPRIHSCCPSGGSMWRRHPCPLCMHRAAVCWSNKWPLQVHPAGSGHSKRSNTTSPSAWTWDPCSEPLDSLGPFLETFGDLKSVEIRWSLLTLETCACHKQQTCTAHLENPLDPTGHQVIPSGKEMMNRDEPSYQNHIWSTSYMAAALLPLQYHCDWTYQHLCQQQTQTASKDLCGCTRHWMNTGNCQSCP